MLTLVTLLWGWMLTQEPSSATHVSNAELEAAFKQAIASNTIDTRVKTIAVEGGNATVAVLYRTKAETSALIHDHVTEIYQVKAGSGTLATGGTLQNPQAIDLTRLGAGMSHTGTHVGGTSQQVKPGDVIVVPAGMPHRFSQLDGPIQYLVYRFEPASSR